MDQLARAGSHYDPTDHDPGPWPAEQLDEAVADALHLRPGVGRQRELDRAGIDVLGVDRSLTPADGRDLRAR